MEIRSALSELNTYSKFGRRIKNKIRGIPNPPTPKPDMAEYSRKYFAALQILAAYFNIINCDNPNSLYLPRFGVTMGALWDINTEDPAMGIEGDTSPTQDFLLDQVGILGKYDPSNSTWEANGMIKQTTKIHLEEGVIRTGWRAELTQIQYAGVLSRFELMKSAWKQWGNDLSDPA